MTLEEFDRDVTTWSELKELDYDCNAYIVDDVLDDDERDDAVWEDIRDFEGSWSELRDLLDEIPDNEYHHRRVDYLEYEDLDNDDFDEAKDELREYMIDNDCFDEDEEDFEEEIEPLIDDSIGHYTKEVSDSGYTFKKVEDLDKDFGSEAIDLSALMVY